MRANRHLDEPARLRLGPTRHVAPFPGARASRPHPAGGRQWTTRRRPTGVSKRARCPRSRARRRAERVSPGARATRPQVGRRPTGVFKRAGCPRSRERRRADRSSLGARATRPQVGRRPTGELKRARCPRSRARRRAERVSLGARATRPQVGRRPTGVFKRTSLPPHGGGGGCPRSRERRSRKVAGTWLDCMDDRASRSPGPLHERTVESPS